MLRGNFLIAQGGGPTAVINQSLVGAVLEARKHNNIERIYGSLKGVVGILDQDFVDLTEIPDTHLEQIAQTPGSALLSTRIKPDAQMCHQMLENMKKHNIRYFFYIGGNDSSDTIRIISDEAERTGYDICAVHLPKTIDNDLLLNDHTPGYGSAAKYVASAFAGANYDNASLQGVYIGVVMGRHAGFLTAASVLGKSAEEDGPHLVYLPERPFDISKFAADVKAVYDRYGRCVVAVSEGIQDRGGTPIITTLQKTVERDSHGNVQLSGTGALGDLLAGYIKENLGISRVRADTLGYMQRSYLGSASSVDQTEARESAAFGVEKGAGGVRIGSVVIERNPGDEYSVTYKIGELEKLAGKTRLMPSEFINSDANGVTQAFIDYAMPLMGPDFTRGRTLNAPKVDKIK